MYDRRTDGGIVEADGSASRLSTQPVVLKSLYHNLGRCCVQQELLHTRLGKLQITGPGCDLHIVMCHVASPGPQEIARQCPRRLLPVLLARLSYLA